MDLKNLGRIRKAFLIIVLGLILSLSIILLVLRIQDANVVANDCSEMI